MTPFKKAFITLPRQKVKMTKTEDDLKTKKWRKDCVAQRQRLRFLTSHPGFESDCWKMNQEERTLFQMNCLSKNCLV